jgi:hypothetical protein
VAIQKQEGYQMKMRVLLVAALMVVACMPSTAVSAPAVSFLEAATYFLTAVDPTEKDTITENEIVLHQYPLAVNLVDGHPCAVSVRNTSNQKIWQFDFCKMTGYQWDNTPQIWVWLGEPNVLCYGKLLPNANYFEDLTNKIATNIKCDLGVGSWGQPVAFQSNWDARMFTTGKIGRDSAGERSASRLMQSFKYIVMLLTPEKQRKPY